MMIVYQGELVEAYDLIMKKAFALEILNGQKTLEIRPYSPFYCSRFVDVHQLEENERRRAAGREDEILAPYRTDIGFIHFHDYGKTWVLDVAIDEIGVSDLTREGVAFLADEFGFHDYDEEWQQYEGMPEDEVPTFFYLHICEVVRQSGLR